MPNDLIQEIAGELGESAAPALQQIAGVVEALGEESARALLAETASIEAGGGMTIPDGSRRRTKGGVFFLLARQRLSRAQRRAIFMGPFGPSPEPKRARVAVTPLPARKPEQARGAAGRGPQGGRGAWADARRGGAAPALRASRLVIHEVSAIAPPPTEDSEEAAPRVASYVAPELFDEPASPVPTEPAPRDEAPATGERPRRRIVTLPTSITEPSVEASASEPRVTRRAPRAPAPPARKDSAVAQVHAESPVDEDDGDIAGDDEDDDAPGFGGAAAVEGGADAVERMLESRILDSILSREIDLTEFEREARELVSRHVAGLLPLLERAVRLEAVQSLAPAPSAAPRPEAAARRRR